jgi:electron transfer flavoprotein alpha subunit
MATLRAVSAAQDCIGAVHLLIAGYECQQMSWAATRIAGLDKVISVDADWLEAGMAADVAEQALAISRSYSHIVIAATRFGNGLARLLAARLGVNLVSGVTGVTGPDTFECSFFAGKACSTVHSDDPIKVLTVHHAAFAAAHVNSRDRVEVEDILPWPMDQGRRLRSGNE